ncbi:MAG TPA: bifunctional riboflavin kinase/FAD synthetase [Firmicutes bacterium]|nr:bifunctional riboflavin kinase/FAD synthetase [Bacillota bacterium]
MDINWVNKQKSTARSVAIGTFDGVHLGHRQLLKNAVALKPKGGTSAALTFDVPPQQYFRGEKRLLISFQQKMALIRRCGIDEIAWLRFDHKLSSLAAEDFVAGILLQELRTEHVICGLDFRFGKKRAGNPQLLKKMGERLGFQVTIVDPVKSNGQEMISSTAIRQLISRGEIEKAAALLGYYPCYLGKVVHGAGRGRRLGFPTANLEIGPGILLPKEGVYLTIGILPGGESSPAVTSIGKNPTFRGKVQTIETFLLDFTGDLYGQKMELQFLKRLRAIESFPTAAKLQKQIEADVSLARTLLTEFHLQGSKVVLR